MVVQQQAERSPGRQRPARGGTPMQLTKRNLIKTAKNEVETLAELHPFSLFETATDLNNEIYSQTHGAK